MTTTLISVASPVRLQLRGVSWKTYQSLVQDLEGEPGKRLTYDCGVLEIMVPLPPHEKYKELIGRFIDVTTEETNTEVCSLGSCTWSREDLQKGVEPDKCYYIKNELAVRGKDKIDLTVDPPPDLVVEIDMTNSSLKRLTIYAALGVPEIWRYDGKTLTIYRLTDGQYQPQPASTVLPLLRSEDLLNFLQLSPTMGQTALIRQFRQWVQQQLLNP